MKLRYLLALAVLAGPACAAPQGEWPEDMRGYTLPKKDWVMIIPATRRADGTVSVWNRQDDWNKRWLVPKATPSGMRTVAVNGDSEDMRIVSAGEIDNMSMSALSRLAEKYGASAIAVAVTDDTGEVAVAAWARGNHATWQAEVPASSPRQAALEMLDQIYSGSLNVPPSEPSQDTASAGSVRIIAERFNEQYQAMEYRIEGDAEALAAVSDVPGMRLTSSNENVPASVDVIIEGSRDIETLLTGAGIDVR